MKNSFDKILHDAKEQIEDPKLREKFGAFIDNPNGDTLKEVMDMDVAGAGAEGRLFGLSAYLGNKGRFCTLTKECQANCN